MVASTCSVWPVMSSGASSGTWPAGQATPLYAALSDRRLVTLSA